MVAVKGNVNSAIAGISLFGLTDKAGIIKITPGIRHSEIAVDAWGGGEIPAEIQCMLSDVMISMTLVHFDRSVLDAVVLAAMASPGAIGTMPRTGARLGNNAARFAAGWNYVELDIFSPVGQIPWRFYNTFLHGTPMVMPLGTEKSLVDLNFRAIPYTTDPWGNGLGSLGAVLWDHVLSTS